MSSPSASKLLALPSSLRAMAWRHATLQLSRASTIYKSSRTYSSSPTLLHDSLPQSSVNQTEITHFTKLASSWWDPHGSSRLLHLMNPLRHDFINRCLSRSPYSSSIDPNEPLDPKQSVAQKFNYLDIGCGGGIFAESAARLSSSASVTAIDPTPECIAVAKQHQRQDPSLLEDGKLLYLNTAIEGLQDHHQAHHQQEEKHHHHQEKRQQQQSSKYKYDIITLFEVIEHIQSPGPFLESCLSYLKPGGWLIGSTITRSNVSWLTTKLVAEDLLRIVPRGTHEWSQYIQPAELKGWAQGRRELEIGAGGLGWEVMGVVYVPGFGWKEVRGSEEWGNYFFGVRKKEDAEVE